MPMLQPASVLVLAASVAAQNPNSCVGQCAQGWSQNCWCNSPCASHHDCCTDYQSACGGTPEAGLELSMLSEASYPEAKCLDGSSAGYYFRNGTTSSSKYLLFFEGGGWCYDSNCAKPTDAGTLSDCTSRSKGSRGSSSQWSKNRDSMATGSLSASKSENPVFFDWNVVYLPYCDGMSFSGDTVVQTHSGALHFKGKAILDAVLNDLKKKGIDTADKVVISGGSAGASTVLWHADHIASELQLGVGKVVAMPDAGFFLDLPAQDGTDCWPNQMRSIYKVSNASLHEACSRKFTGQQRWKCMFPEYYAELIATPTFLIQSLYDSSELWDTLKLDCCPQPCHGYPTCAAGSAQLELFYKLRTQHVQKWAPLVGKAGNGVWSPACIDHTMTWVKWTDRAWEVPSSSGNTMATAVQNWLEGNDKDGKHYQYEDAMQWPNNKGCSNADMRV